MRTSDSEVQAKGLGAMLLTGTVIIGGIAMLGRILTTGRPAAETKRRYTMEVREIVGHSIDELAIDLEVMESSMAMGEKARISICSESLPGEADLAEMFLGMLATGCHLSYPTARVVGGVPTTAFVLQKGSPQWQLILPILAPLFTIGLIAFGITKIESISSALMPLMLVTIGGAVIMVAVLSKPATKYIERGGTLPRLASTSKKALAVR